MVVMPRSISEFGTKWDRAEFLHTIVQVRERDLALKLEIIRNWPRQHNTSSLVAFAPNLHPFVLPLVEIWSTGHPPVLACLVTWRKESTTHMDHSNIFHVAGSMLNVSHLKLHGDIMPDPCSSSCEYIRQHFFAPRYLYARVFPVEGVCCTLLGFVLSITQSRDFQDVIFPQRSDAPQVVAVDKVRNLWNNNIQCWCFMYVLWLQQRGLAAHCMMPLRTAASTVSPPAIYSEYTLFFQHMNLRYQV